MFRSRLSKILLTVVLFLWFFSGTVLDLWVDWQWFSALGHPELFSTRITTQVSLFLVSFTFAFAIIFTNLRIASRSVDFDLGLLQEQLTDVQLSKDALASLFRLGGWLLALAPAALIAWAISQQWLYALAFLDPVPFGEQDPVFGKDLSFYVFQLPIVRFAIGACRAVLVLSLLIVGIQSFARDVMLGSEEGPPSLHPKAQRHLSVLVGLLFIVVAGEWYIERYDLLLGKNGVVWGVGYADQQARVPAYAVMGVLSLLVTVAMFVSYRQSHFRLPITALVGYFVLRLLLVGAWPTLIQDFMVQPNELGLESEFMVRNISATQKAYALDRIEVQPFEAEENLSSQDIQNNPLTINNVRVWDDRPLLTTYGQLQEIRTYYDFADVDIDRYVINGELRQVMLSARELNYANVSKQAQSWVNEHFQYTHGYGLTMSPVNVVTREGLPSLFVQDIPPTTNTDISLPRAEIYYGELTNQYIVVNGSIEEFDYPEGDKNKYTNYEGTGGVSIGGMLERVFYSAYFGDVELILSNYVTAESRVLFRRNIKERVQHLAPFLYFDSDPYLVLEGDTMVWMLDGYTTTRDYPYAEPTNGGRFNYIRNSVKVVIDAYNGDVSFFVADETDPMIQVYQKVFPETFKSLEALPNALRSHIRYPVDFFNVQAQMYRKYHMTDPTVFYNSEDMWAFPKELYAGQEQRMQSYYLIMKLPNTEQAEFILLLPFVPMGKDNMISWLAARCDDPNYGSLILYQFPKQKLIYGPRQIEARIDQDPEISQQITLWSQSGSRVVRGNLLVIPIGNSLVYVEPLYLQAESSQLPELKQVIVSYDNRIAMEATLAESLEAVFGKAISSAVKKLSQESQQAGTAAGVKQAGGGAGWQDLASQAAVLLTEATDAQKSGEWAAYGEKLSQLTSIISELDALSQQAIAPDVTSETPKSTVPETETP